MDGETERTSCDLPGAARSYQAGERRLHHIIMPFSMIVRSVLTQLRLELGSLSRETEREPQIYRAPAARHPTTFSFTTFTFL